MTALARRAPVLLLAAAGLGCAAAQSPTSAPTAESIPLIFEGVTVVDVVAGRLVADRAVLIAGRHIGAIRRTGTLRVPAEARVIDARGKYLIPGLWDMHVHAQDDGTYAPLLAFGITGVREMSTSRLPVVLQWRREIAAGTRAGPRIVTPGPFLQYRSERSLVQQAQDHWGSFLISIASPDEGRRVVDSLKAVGVDFIKIRDQYDDRLGEAGDMPRAVYFAVATEARRLGLPLAGHYPRFVTIAEASDSGQHSFEHVAIPADRGDLGPYVADACLGAPDSAIAPVGACTTLAAVARRHDSWFTPTMVMQWGPHTPFRSFMQRLARFHFPVLAGTDALLQGKAEDTLRARRLQRELSIFVEAGMTPLEALQTATYNPARYFHATDSLGTVVPGKLADLVLLDADPLADIQNVTAVRAVVANGHYYDRAALGELRTSLKRVAPP